MSCRLKGRSFLTLLDYSEEEIRCLLEAAHKAKKEKKSGKIFRRFASKTLALLFEKRSTRTRCAFETAFGEEGGHPVFLGAGDIHLGEKESIEDTARVMGRMFDCIMFRGYEQKTAEILAEYSGVPVYNGLTDLFHPTQTLADLMTMEEAFGTLNGKKCVYIGDGRNNVARSLLAGCSIMGVHTTIVAPEELRPDREFVARCGTIKKAGVKIEITDSVDTGLDGADVVYTDVWVSMGEEEKEEERVRLLTPYRVTETLMKKSGKSETIFLHCLPAVKGKEVTAPVIEGSSSRVWDQAENRKHTIKALMLLTL
ncbi:MAG: ornithine carbamoyltransferase [Spirochaetales bacterium]|nr:ornithine carbamoyltransferase [Spirochaetales bacterium]